MTHYVYISSSLEYKVESVSVSVVKVVGALVFYFFYSHKITSQV